MNNRRTLRENILFLLDRYKKELELEEQKSIEEQNIDSIYDYKNIIIELEFALHISLDKK